MKSKTRILVPIDFSEESIDGLKTALDIAKTINGELHLLHVIDEPTGTDFNLGGDMIENEKKYQENVHYTGALMKRKLEQLRGLRVQYHDPAIPMDFTVENGLYKDGLEDYLSHHQIDLIVMGTTGETAITEIFSGNHAELALRIADVPVFAVQKHYSPLQLDKVMLGVDLKEYDEQPVRLIKRFADLLHMKVLITHVKQHKDTVVDDVADHLHRFAKKHGFHNYSVFITEKGKVAEKLQEAADDKGADIIATISEGDTGFIRLLFGSKTEKIMEETEKPVLSVRE